MSSIPRAIKAVCATLFSSPQCLWSPLLFHWPAAHGRAANSIVRRRGAWYEEWLYQPDKVKKWVSWLIEVREDGPGEPAVGRGRFRTLHVAPDLPAAERKLVAATQGATNGTVFGAKVSSVAWKSKPSWYVLSTNDRMIQPDLQRRFAKDINARTTSIPSSHVPMLSHPAAVAQVIIEAARTARSQ